MCVSVDGEPVPCPKAALFFLLTVCFSLVSHPLPSLMNNCLNLPIGTQGRSWRLNEGNQRNGDTGRLCAQEPHRALLGVTRNLGATLDFPSLTSVPHIPSVPESHTLRSDLSLQPSPPPPALAEWRPLSILSWFMVKAPNRSPCHPPHSFNLTRLYSNLHISARAFFLK